MGGVGVRATSGDASSGGSGSFGGSLYLATQGSGERAGLLRLHRGAPHAPLNEFATSDAVALSRRVTYARVVDTIVIGEGIGWFKDAIKPCVL